MVERFVRDEEAAGSNPVTSTTLNSIQLIWMLFFLVCIIFRQDSNLLSIVPRAETTPKVCVSNPVTSTSHNTPML